MVLGSQADDIEASLSSVTEPRLAVVRCADWADGLSASLRCGLDCLPDDCRAALIFLGDMPNIDPRPVADLLKAVLDGAPAALIEFEGAPGHPVAVSRRLFPQLRRLEGDRGARVVLKKLDDVVKVRAASPGCIEDVDTTRDLDRLRGGTIDTRINGITAKGD